MSGPYLLKGSLLHHMKIHKYKTSYSIWKLYWHNWIHRLPLIAQDLHLSRMKLKENNIYVWKEFRLRSRKEKTKIDLQVFSPKNESFCFASRLRWVPAIISTISVTNWEIRISGSTPESITSLDRLTVSVAFDDMANSKSSSSLSSETTPIYSKKNLALFNGSFNLAANNLLTCIKFLVLTENE